MSKPLLGKCGMGSTKVSWGYCDWGQVCEAKLICQSLSSLRTC